MMKVLFITRTYPPLVGGMEKFASGFYENYRHRAEIDLLANSGGKRKLISFLMRATFQLAFRSRGYDLIHIYDGVLFPLIPVARVFSRAKVSITVNGLDIVYAGLAYQKIMPLFLRQADKIFAISHYTMEQCRSRGLPKEKLVVAPVGFDCGAASILSEEEKAKAIDAIRVPLQGKKVLLTIGRLVRRKGHTWFIEHVMRRLPSEYIYLVAGDGPERDRISAAVRRLGLADRVFALGLISEQEKNLLYQTADVFVMPNIHLKNDQEGFGIVILEAACYGIPVIAANIEGIGDAFIDPGMGRLVAEKDVDGFVDAIMQVQPAGPATYSRLLATFSWDTIVERYHREFEKLTLG